MIQILHHVFVFVFVLLHVFVFVFVFVLLHVFVFVFVFVFVMQCEFFQVQWPNTSNVHGNYWAVKSILIR